MALRGVAVGFLLLSLIPPLSRAGTPTIRDLARIIRVSDPHYAPDGKMLVVVEKKREPI